jgi:hypothetical protein
MNKYLKLFNNILKAIPSNIFKHKESINEAAIDIFLTATGVRPACIPFDGEIKYDGMGSNKMIQIIHENPKCLDKLRNIKEITIIIGPYYDVGTSIVVANTLSFKSGDVSQIIPKLDKIAEKYGDARSNAKHIHELIGKLLGYTCPMDLPTILKMKDVYTIAFEIDGRLHMPVWCPNDKKYINKALEQLNSINNVLKHIDKEAKLIIYPK